MEEGTSTEKRPTAAAKAAASNAGKGMVVEPSMGAGPAIQTMPSLPQQTVRTAPPLHTGPRGTREVEMQPPPGLLRKHSDSFPSKRSPATSRGHSPAGERERLLGGNPPPPVRNNSDTNLKFNSTLNVNSSAGAVSGTSPRLMSGYGAVASSAGAGVGVGLGAGVGGGAAGAGGSNGGASPAQVRLAQLGALQKANSFKVSPAQGRQWGVGSSRRGSGSSPGYSPGSTRTMAVPTLRGDDDGTDDAAEDKLEDADAAKDKFLMICFASFVVIALMNRVFQKLETIPMYNYPVFLSLLTTFIYIPASFSYIIPMQLQGKIGKEQTEIPKYKFAIMGCLDSLASAMQIFAVNFITNASILVLLSQSAIPISMMISKLFLKASYSITQYLGALIVCVGIVVVLLPQLSGKSGEEDNGHSQVLWSAVNIISCIPMALSSVYKEKALQGQDIDVVYLNGWVSVFQFILCIPLTIPSAFVVNLPLSDLPQNLLDGFHCLMGRSSVYMATAALGATVTDSSETMDGVEGMDAMPEDHCAKAPFYVWSYCLFNLLYNVLIVVILKYGSANIMYLGSTALVPLTNAAFAMPWLPGHKPVKPTDLYGLIVIMLGITTYRFYDDLKSLLLRKLGFEDADEPTAAERERERTRTQVLQRAALYVGLNQAEALGPLMDERVKKAARNKMVPRSPAQIRGSYMYRLGLAPSPKVTGSPGSFRRSPPPTGRSLGANTRPPATSINV